MGKQYLHQLIRKYLGGKATDDEKRQLDAWWDYNLCDDSYLRFLPDDEQARLFDQMLAGIHQRIEQPDDTAPIVRPFVVSRRSWWPALRVAAALLLVFFGGILTYRYVTTRPTLETAYGERREVRLPDGSVVMLNGNSSLRYGPWEADSPREVWLEGEAFFSVTHTRNHQRFVVHTPDQLAVEVLGTRFNVQNRHGATQVVLQDGKVRVTDAEQHTATLRPGEALTYQAARPRLTSTRTDVVRALSWKDNLLLFQDQPLSAVFGRLRDSHNLQVELRDTTLANQPFSGSVPTDRVEEVFDKVEKIYGVQVRREGDRYVID